LFAFAKASEKPKDLDTTIYLFVVHNQFPACEKACIASNKQ
ncbi:MAG: hypothetical protein ACI828_002833, partial [Flavobacteriales bacterium]